MSEPEDHRSLYAPVGFAMVRTPLLPVQAFASLRTEADQFALLQDPRVRRAVAAGSLSLLHALDRLEQSGLTRREAERLAAKLLRYQIRMSTRPTPYGLFAGCAVVPIGGRTDLRMQTTFGRSHTRPDMAWLMALVAAAESEPGILRHLTLVANPLIRVQGDRVSLAARAPAGAGGGSQPVSVRATTVVVRALELAKTPIGYDALSVRLREATAGATEEKVDRLLADLCGQTFLLTDLRPPLTIDSPARYVLNRLAAIPAGTAAYERLRAALDAAAAWDAVPHAASAGALHALLRAAGSPEDGSNDAPFQVDLSLSVDGRLGRTLADEAARAAELLLRLSPSPRGIPALAAYRHAFVTRYGSEREVPLLELLDPDRGLGPPGSHGFAYVGPEQGRAARRSSALLACACAALHHRHQAVDLDDRLLATLETWEDERVLAPPSLDVNVLVAARSGEAIDEGDFTLVIGPNLGAWAAGRSFGRFAHLDPDRGIECVRACARAEDVAQAEDVLPVEVVFLPANARLANVTIRPVVREYEIVFGASPGVPASHVVPLDELLVGVANGRFYVRWPAAGKRLHFTSGHMLNPHTAPAAAQFLLQVSHDAAAVFSGFDWGPAEEFPFLPRVQSGRIVLRPAEWKIPKAMLHPDRMDAIETWRRDWDVPRVVALAAGDNRLVLDLDRPAHARQLLAEAARLPDGRSLVVHELVPSLEDAWLAGSEGRYYSEIVVPLVRRAPRGAAVEAAGIAESTGAPRDAAGAAPAAAVRRHPPGSAWLFVKLYCPSHCEDVLIADALSGFCRNVRAAELADSWFFIRYADPEGHVRLRFHGDPDRLARQLFPQICRWAQELMAQGTCTRFVFDTYDQEIERFGGAEGMAASEDLFHADSRAAAALVGALQTREWSDEASRTPLLAASIDDLLDALGLDESARLGWYEEQGRAAAREAGGEYRTLKSGLRAAVGDRDRWLCDRPHGSAIDEALAERRRDLVDVSRRLRALSDARRLGQPIGALAVSYVHLHLNRLGASARERSLLGMLLRTREGLAKAPVVRQT
jgi:thiopeptide-type bacteriocin biosynthesis protein